MPIGDSITEANNGDATYRYFLERAVASTGCAIDFVGSSRGVWRGEPRYAGFDQDHEGHWGWRADQVLAGMGSWAQSYAPDVALIHLGTNDLWQGQTPLSTAGEIGQIIAALRGANPRVTVLLALLIPVVSSTGFSVDPLNQLLPPLAQALTTPESPVILVDQWTGFDPALHTYDGVHPNYAGEQRMADRWFAALRRPLGIAGHEIFGAACSGGGVSPTVVAASRPLLGARFDLDVGGLGAWPVAAGLFGVSRSRWSGLPLPLDLGWLGMAGCQLRVSVDELSAVPVSAGAARWSLPIPTDPTAAGLEFFMQMLVVAPGANPSGLLATEAVAVQIGNR